MRDLLANVQTDGETDMAKPTQNVTLIMYVYVIIFISHTDR